jgi:hypothetical protein
MRSTRSPLCLTRSPLCLTRSLALCLTRSLALCLTLSASAARADEPPSEAQALRAQLESAQREARDQRERLSALTAERDALTARLTLAETRLGLHPFTPRALTPMSALAPTHTPAARSPLPRQLRARALDSARGRVTQGDLRALLEAGPALIALWATWCKPCVSPEEQAHLRRLNAALAPLGVPLVSLGVDEWDKVEAGRARWFYPLWHLKDAHVELTPEVVFKKVGLGLPLFFLRLPGGEVPFVLSKTLSDEAVEEWVTAAARARLGRRLGSEEVFQ